MSECASSIANFLFSLGSNLIDILYQNPLVCSCILTGLIMLNIHLARLISQANCSCLNQGVAGVVGCLADFGENQSPINITKDQVEACLQEKLIWNNYDDLPTSMTIENNGRTVILKAKFADHIPNLCGSDLEENYTFIQICFRWSYLNFEGSEHCIDGKKYPLEMQVMHRARFVDECRSSYDLLMIAYLFEVSTHNPYLDPLILNLHRIQKVGTQVNIAPFPLSWICHPFRTNFYSYGGSSTDPPYVDAEWYILTEPITISENQLAEFRLLEAEDRISRITRNARPLQVLDDSRIIRFNHCSRMDRFILQPENCECATSHDSC